MRIIGIHIENVKRVLKVEVRPEAGLVQISGKNGSGKSSVLDAIEWALAGDRSIDWKPVRKGQVTATIRLEIGEGETVAYRVTKTIKDHGEGNITKLLVQDAEGAPARKPQDILNSFVGNLTLDPVDFINRKPDDRIAILKGLVPGVDWPGLAAKRQRIFDQRTEARREAKRLKAVLASRPEVKDAPPELVDINPLMGELAKAGLVATEIASIENARAGRRGHAASCIAGAVDLEAQANEVLERAKDLRSMASKAEREADAMPNPPAPIDTTAIREQIDKARTANEKFKAKAERLKIDIDLADAEGDVIGCDEAIDSLDEGVAAIIAKSDLPVRNLTLGEGDVMLDGQPFGQASFAEQLRASIGLAMAENPKLRVIRIRHGGNDLDEDAMAILKEVAESDGFDIWIERVVPIGEAAVVMENGEAKDG